MNCISKKVVKLMDAYSNANINNYSDAKIEEIYYAFAQKIYDMMRDNPILSIGIFEMAFSSYFKNNSYKRKNDVCDVQDLLDYIEKLLKLNVGTHFLLIPLQASSLEKTECLDDSIVLLKHDDDIENMYRRISEITNVKITTVKFMLEHTQKSRYPDFLKSNLMIYKISDQTDNVRSSIVEIANSLLWSMEVIHQASDIKEDLLRKLQYYNENPCHFISVLSSDEWRCDNRYSHFFSFTLNYDLNFLKNVNVKRKFLLLKEIMIKKNKNDLEYLISDSIRLFGKAEYERTILKDEEIAFILYFTTLESLISQNYSRKRFCLSNVIPEMIDILDKSALLKKIDKLYLDRNAFIHTGRKLYFYSDEINLCEELSIITAKVIVSVAEKYASKEVSGIEDYKKFINDIYARKKSEETSNELL